MHGNIIQFSEKDLKNLIRYLLYDLSVYGFISERYTKEVDSGEGIPDEIYKEVGDTINVCLAELQEYGNCV